MTVDVTLTSIYAQYTFEKATNAEIEKMLNAHYNGEINIEDYWHVGDTRLVHINAIPADNNNSTSHVAQDMTFVIIGINHDDLKDQIGSRTKAAITVQCREVLGNKGIYEQHYYWR